MRISRFLAAGVLFCAAGLVGQTDREAYREAYDAWQQAQTNLEREAATGGTALVSKVDRAESAAIAFEATRSAYLKFVAEDADQRQRIVRAPVTRPTPDLAAPAVANLAATELQMVNRTIGKFADDKDRGIQQLRQSLERERITLTALNDAVQARQKSVATTSAAAAAAEQVRARAAEALDSQASLLSGEIAALEKESSAWADYYEKLAQAIQVANAPPPPVGISAVAPRNTSITPVPLARYVGSWMYPATNGIFHGAQPESVDLVVREQNGHAEGTMSAKFKLSPGSATDPVIRFDFAGDFAATANQRFTMVTADKAQGVLELIPGPAFNLLEVNFLMDPQPNKIRGGNFILVKK
jgi:hypothetical protein